MLPTSEEYKALVYYRDFTRHGEGSFGSSNPAFYNDYDQLINNNLVGAFNYGTLEDGQFVLDGSKRLMNDEKLPDEEYGWGEDTMSDENGLFNPPLQLSCKYERKITSIGRTIVFDENYDSVPKDFDLYYYRDGTLITAIKITDNQSYQFVSKITVERYDAIMFIIYSMTKPYRRVHMIEDIPGSFVLNEYYSKDYARHFVPEITLQVIDTKARRDGGFSASDKAFYSNLDQLVNENLDGEFTLGTLEDFQFLLDGSKVLMPDEIPDTAEYGWCTERISNDSGDFDPPVVLTCQYQQEMSTVGRSYSFDKNYDAVPKDFDIAYYLKGVLVHTTEVRDNEKYTVVTLDGVENYDRVILTIYSMTLPYRRVHMIEDIPGVYMVWDEQQIVELMQDQEVDIYCTELITGVANFNIDNAAKTLNILNAEGFERFLRRRQPVDIALKMVYPDKSTERIPLGVMRLAEWKVPKDSIEASFTAYDALEDLSLGEYIKGDFPETAMSMYEYAELVLQDAGIESYTIDIQLMNVYTTAPLPVASHKELLRLIAQASQATVLPQLDGGVHLKYISPLTLGTNFVSDPAFNNGLDNWVCNKCELYEEYVYAGRYAIKINQDGELKQVISNTYDEHKYYVRFYAMAPDTMSGEGCFLYCNGEQITIDLANAGLRTGEWFFFSDVFTCEGTSIELLISNGASPVVVDAFTCLDLTVTYGRREEPTKDWCDKNIRFFTTQLMIPRAEYATPVDDVDYNSMFTTPEIVVREAVKSVTASVYSYKTSDRTSEVYKATHYVSGTDTFNIRFSSMAKECEITVEPESSSETAELLESTIYARAATIRVRANGNVVVTVTGKAVTTETSDFTVDESLDAELIPDAKEITIDNKLITNKTLAEDVVAYATYWYKKSYDYDFDWRQNPALEVLDTVIVHDDFDVDNAVLLTDRTLDYQEGVLTGNSKGVC